MRRFDLRGFAPAHQPKPKPRERIRIFRSVKDTSVSSSGTNKLILITSRRKADENESAKPSNGSVAAKAAKLTTESANTAVQKSDVEKQTKEISQQEDLVQVSKSCVTCLIVWLIVLGILFLIAMGFSILALTVFFWNGKPAMENWDYLTSYD